MPSQHIDTIYQDNHQWLVGWLLKKVDCQEQAADLAHDTFVRVLQIMREKPDLKLREPRAFLRPIANGLVVDYYRKSSLERSYQQALSDLPEAAALSAEEVILLREMLEQLDNLLSQLPKRARTVFLLSQLEGMPYLQISEQLGISLRTVKRDMRLAVIQCLTLSW